MTGNSCSVVLTELGIAAFDESGGLIASKKFGDATRSYRLLRSGATPDEVRDFIEKLRSFDLVTANDASTERGKDSSTERRSASLPPRALCAVFARISRTRAPRRSNRTSASNPTWPRSSPAAGVPNPVARVLR